MNEDTIWSGHSSQWSNLKIYFFGILIVAGLLLASIFANIWFALLVIYPLGRMAFAAYATRTAKYRLTSQRLIFQYGVFNRVTSEIELYRVKDVLLFEPWNLRLVGLGNIQLVSSQRNAQHFNINAIAQATEVREAIRKAVEQRRTEKRVGEFDTSSID